MRSHWGCQLVGSPVAVEKLTCGRNFRGGAGGDGEVLGQVRENVRYAERSCISAAVKLSTTSIACAESRRPNC